MVVLVNKKLMKQGDALENESAAPTMLHLSPFNLKGIRPPPGLELMEPPAGPLAPPPEALVPGTHLAGTFTAEMGTRGRGALRGGRPPRRHRGLCPPIVHVFPAKIFSDANAHAGGYDSEDTGLGSEAVDDSSIASRQASSVSSDPDTVLSNADDSLGACRAAAHKAAAAAALRSEALRLLSKARGVTPNVPKQTVAKMKLSAKAASFVPTQRQMPAQVGPLPMPVVPCPKQAVNKGRYLRWLQEAHPEFVGSKAEQEHHFDL